MSEVREEYTRETYPSFGKKYNNEKAIISLTSWKARINTVNKTLFSLLKQTEKFHIILVLSEDEFPRKEKELPANLMVFVENDLIELLWCKENIKSHKKYFYTMQKYKDVPIITVDDDSIYDKDMAYRLYEAWQCHPNCVCANRCHLITFDDTGNVCPYNKWKYMYDKEMISDLLFPTGVGGVLYPPGCFNLTEENKKELNEFFYNDDFYLKFLEIRNNIKVYNVKTKHRRPGISNNASPLADININKKQNDVYIQKIKAEFEKIKVT